jgi:hypothetical protein
VSRVRNLTYLLLLLLTLPAHADLDSNLLLNAAEKGDTATVRAMLKKGADINITDRDGLTPLMWACYMGHFTITKVLLDKGANVNAKDYSGSTALLWAATKGHAITVQALLDKGADVNKKRDDGMTALMLAVKKDHKNVARILIRNGANVKAKNNDGKTAWDLAKKKGMVQLLKKGRTRKTHQMTNAKYKQNKAKWDIELVRFGWASNEEGQSMSGVVVDIQLPKTKGFAQFDSSSVILYHSNKKRYSPYAILIIGINPGISGDVVGSIYRGMIQIGSKVYIGSDPENSPPYNGTISIDLVSGGFTTQDGVKIIKDGSYLEVNYRPAKTKDLPTDLSSRNVLAIILEDDTSPGFASFVFPKGRKIRVGFLFQCNENIKRLSVMGKTLDLKF